MSTTTGGVISVEFLWSAGCPNHETAEAILRGVLQKCGIGTPIVRIAVEDEEAGRRVRFPGSPTIRINGRDVEPGYDPAGCSDCTPRCRLYLTDHGLTGVPRRNWIEDAIHAARPSGSTQEPRTDCSK